MELYTLLWVICILCLKNEGESSRGKFILQNEMSEHCRRQAVSSIFLGRQVATSSAEIMQFSRLELPYSCSISVRTESGSSIILVILSESDKSITRSCREGYDQFLVYEMGETFGGYWAALPESVFQQEPRNHSTYYTLKTTQAILETVDIGITDYDTTSYTEEIVSKITSQDVTDRDYVVMEIPLVNVSGNIELGDTELPTPGDEIELFDLIYDVTPKNGVLYDTTLMPLMQFSVGKEKGQNQGFVDTESRYQLEYNLRGVTPDYRLMFQTNHQRRNFPRRPHHSTRRLKFNKKSKHFFSVNNWASWYRNMSNTRFELYQQTKYTSALLTTKSLNNGESMDSIYKNRTDTWQLAESYLNFLNVNNLSTIPENINDEKLALLKKISNMKHNASVYLQPNLLKYSSNGRTNDAKVDKVGNNVEIGSFSTALPVRINYLQQNTSSIYNSEFITNNVTTPKNQIEITTDSTLSISKNYTRELTTTEMLSNVGNHQETRGIGSKPILSTQLENFKESMTQKRSKTGSGSLVDHESWDNIVQVAPAMVDLLNSTESLIDDNTRPTPSVGHRNKINRKKRYIQAISIDHHRPRQLTTKEDVPLPDQRKRHFDSQQLAELVELQDDEIQGRVALHYFKNYVGSTFFNMCDYREAKERQVYFFNSSRIVIALNNFTMDRITIVMTESRMARGAGCPPAHVECQVSGVRVCVHHMNACDGLPNCGAYDVFDEDRLLCGSNIGFHYTVFLAACTFLVVLLTLLYTVHYWLKRCVPKVSQAFFVYTDKSENILYLDTIMRSPNDFDGGSRLVYHSSFFDDDLSTDSIKTDNRKVLNIITKCLRCLFCKKYNISDDKDQQDTSYSYPEPKRKFSFTEAELRKIGPISTMNTGTQTGESLEMAHLKEIKVYNRLDGPFKPRVYNQLGEESSFSKKINTVQLQQNERELSSLRRTLDISSSSSKTYLDKKFEKYVKESPLNEEVEIRNTMYDRENKCPVLGKNTLERTKYEVHSEPVEQNRNAIKHLRFEEETTTIPSAGNIYDDEDNDNERHSSLSRTGRLTNMDLDVIEKDEETAGTSGRDFRRFWGRGKGKKNKKKTQLSLR